MSWQNINLIHIFSWYLAGAIVVGTMLRWRNYRHLFGLIFIFQRRWPRLLGLFRQHHEIFWQWSTILPVACTVFLMLVNGLASTLIWSQASVTPQDLVEHRLSALIVFLSGTLMLMFDVKMIFKVTQWNRQAIESSFDKAEHWLVSWRAPALKYLTFGYINPHKMVNAQVREAVEKANVTINGQFWLWSWQFVLRLVFGVSLWIVWFVHIQESTAASWR